MARYMGAAAVIAFVVLFAIVPGISAGDDGYVPPDTIGEEGIAMVTEIKGSIVEDGRFLPEPWFSYVSQTRNMKVDSDGEYSVCLYDEKGKLLSKTGFDVKNEGRVRTPEGESLLEGIKIPVSVSVKLLGGAEKISIQKGAEAIFTREVSKNAPTVGFTNIDANQVMDGKVTIKWEASDADGDELYFKLSYYHDLLNGASLGQIVTGTELEVDLSGYPGTEDGFFHIYATDGVLTAEDYSPHVRVTYKAPEVVRVIPDVREAKVTERVVLMAEVYDVQDGRQVGGGVEWAVDGGPCMAGDYFFLYPYGLEPGAHTVTCMATNSAGLSASRELELEILDDESDLPDDWSRDEVVGALRLGFYVPLARIEAPITRVEFAGLMYHLHGAGAPVDVPAPGAGNTSAITDCGEMDYPAASLMVRLGVMAAPGGLFEPARSMTQREAMLAMYKTSVLAADWRLSIGDIEYTDDEIIALYTKNGMFAGDAENAYAPDEKLPKKLALVRVFRQAAEQEEIEQEE